MTNVQKTYTEKDGLIISDVIVIDDLHPRGGIVQLNCFKELNLLERLEGLPESGTGEAVNNFYREYQEAAKAGSEMVQRHNPHRSPSLMRYETKGAVKIVNIRYRTANFRGPVDLFGFTFEEYIQMERPRNLEVTSETTHTFTKIEKMPEKYIGPIGQ